MPLTLLFPADRPGDATYAALAAQVEAGMARVIQERRVVQRRTHREPTLHPDQRWGWRRQAVPLPGVLRFVVTA